MFVVWTLSRYRAMEEEKIRLPGRSLLVGRPGQPLGLPRFTNIRSGQDGLLVAAGIQRFAISRQE